jgi:hypothetical protein
MKKTNEQPIHETLRLVLIELKKLNAAQEEMLRMHVEEKERLDRQDEALFR